MILHDSRHITINGSPYLEEAFESPKYFCQMGVTSVNWRTKQTAGWSGQKSCFKCFQLMTKSSFPMSSQVMKLVTPIVGVCNCSMFCYTFLYVDSSIIAIILMGKRELVALLYLSSWCLVMVEQFFLAVPWDCPRLVIVAFPDHTHLLFLGPLFWFRQRG